MFKAICEVTDCFDTEVVSMNLLQTIKLGKMENFTPSENFKCRITWFEI